MPLIPSHIVKFTPITPIEIVSCTCGGLLGLLTGSSSRVSTYLHIAVANPVQRGADLAEEYKMMADGRCPTSPELTELVKAPLKVYSGSSNVTIALRLLIYVGIVPSLLVNVAFKGACWNQMYPRLSILYI